MDAFKLIHVFAGLTHPQPVGTQSGPQISAVLLSHHHKEQQSTLRVWNAKHSFLCKLKEN